MLKDLGIVGNDGKLNEDAMQDIVCLKELLPPDLLKPLMSLGLCGRGLFSSSLGVVQVCHCCHCLCCCLLMLSVICCCLSHLSRCLVLLFYVDFSFLRLLFAQSGYSSLLI